MSSAVGDERSDSDEQADKEGGTGGGVGVTESDNDVAKRAEKTLDSNSLKYTPSRKSTSGQMHILHILRKR